MDQKKEIIKIVNSISGRYSPYEVFTDWIRCSAIAISNQTIFKRDKVWKDREQAYTDTMKKYELAERMKLVEMFHLLVETLETKMTDVLGEIYMEAGMGSKASGQFFTPYHLSELCAELSITQINENEVYTINEPSCGGGGMIIAAASVLKKRGINYQKIMEVVAQDLDWKGVYMCYLQLSLLGIKAICVQGDTISSPYAHGKTEQSSILITPAKMWTMI